MAGRERNPAVLKAEAQALLNRAKMIEERKFIQAGALVDKYYQQDFAEFDLEQFKREMSEVFKGKKK